MGYELKLRVKDRLLTHEYPKGAISYWEDLTVDLYKPGSFSKIAELAREYLLKEKPTPYYYRCASGHLDDNSIDQPIDCAEVVTVVMLDDPYGDWTTPCPIFKALAALTIDQEREPYRRFEIAIAALTAYSKHFPEAVVFFEGH